jgi:hypothetical protein
MTIVVSVQCSEGIVLAADSAIAIFPLPDDDHPSKGEPVRPIRVWPHAKKVSHISDYNVGVLSFGLGALGLRNIQSLMYEFEVSGRAKPGKKWNVRQIADDLHSFLSLKYAEVFGHVHNPEMTLGMLVAGYSKGSFEPEQYRFVIPYDKSPIRLTFGGARVGIVFFGLPEPIYRLVNGIDADLTVALSKVSFTQEQLLQLTHALVDRMVDEERIDAFLAAMKGSPAEIDKFVAWKDLLSYDVVLKGMPLQDGIDLATWLIEATIGSYRFAKDSPLAAGAIDVAVITHAAFTWIQRKSWHGYNRYPTQFPAGGAR